MIFALKRLPFRSDAAVGAVHNPEQIEFPSMAGDDEVGFLVPGGWVRHPGQPDWGNGQIQSVIGNRITVNFEQCGKVVIDRFQIDLEAIDSE